VATVISNLSMKDPNVLNRHILVISSEGILTPKDPLAGIFEFHQAQTLTKAGYQVGMLSIEGEDSAFEHVVHCLKRPTPSSFSALSAAIKASKNISHESLAGIPVVRTRALHTWRYSARYNLFGWLKAARRAFSSYTDIHGTPDLIHAHNALYAGLFAQEMKRTGGIPYVVTEHSSVIGQQKVFSPLLHRIQSCYEEASELVVVSSFLGIQIQKLFDGDVRGWTCVPNILDPEFYHAPEPVPDSNSAGFQFSAIGSLIPIKGHELLIRAFYRAFQNSPETTLQIAGDGPLRKSLESLIAERDMAAQVSLLGYVDRADVRHLLDHTDALVVASEFETFGVVVIEALSRGVPVVFTDCGGPCTILDSSNGLCCDSNEEALATALAKIQEQIRDYDKAAIRKNCLATYGPTKFCQHMDEIYQAALENRLRARTYQQCSVSVMDTLSDPDIGFDHLGRSSYLHLYRKATHEGVLSGVKGQAKLEELADSIKRAGRNRKYDCIMGLSGGVDSTYLAMIAKQLGLRIFAVHFDNGWNSELAVANIENIVSRLDIDLFTYVIDWDEFKDLQLAYLKASVVDIEALTDHAILGTLYRLAFKNRIKFILSGTNIQTETTLPRHWIYRKTDGSNIKSIHKAHGLRPLKTYPFMTAIQRRLYTQVLGISSVSMLNYVDYQKDAVKKTITEELGWRDYGGKHFESIWTRFYQGYILPAKFGIDKRKAHLSDLIFGEQITREIAISELETPPYDPEQLKIDKEFALKKLGVSEAEFTEWMTTPRREHRYYDHERPFEERYPRLATLKHLVKHTLARH
jgi:N-acetyl sugar amidotransferase